MLCAHQTSLVLNKLGEVFGVGINSNHISNGAKLMHFDSIQCEIHSHVSHTVVTCTFIVGTLV